VRLRSAPDAARGVSVDDVRWEEEPRVRSYQHMLLVLGGVAGLEDVVGQDPDLRARETSSLFDYYLNTCPNQGSNTIRTEEAMLVTLSALRPALLQRGRTDGS
jgi:predicted SPOUT superfamily RNA methylase MTH1